MKRWLRPFNSLVNLEQLENLVNLEQLENLVNLEQLENLVSLEIPNRLELLRFLVPSTPTSLRKICLR